MMTVGWVCLLVGCQTGLPGTVESRADRQSAEGGGSAVASEGQPAALIGGQPVSWASLRPVMVEAGGGQALSERVVSVLAKRRLAQRGLSLTPELVDAEKARFLATIDDDPDRAQRILTQLRVVRGLGDDRFTQTLERNAALRLMVQDQVQVTPAAIEQMYELRYGKRYEARIITVDTLAKAGEIVRRARGGQSFIDLAARESTDVSRAQGGLMPLVSPADPTFPQSIRSAVERMTPGQISEPIALEAGFAVLRLERIDEGSSPPMDRVREQLEAAARLEIEQILMQQLLRSMLRDAEVIVLDRDLRAGWEYQRGVLMGDQQR